MAPKQGLIKSLPGVYMSLGCAFNMTVTLPVKPHGSLRLTLLRPLRGRGALRGTVKRVTRALTTGVTRGSSRFTEVLESHQASGGIYEGGGEEKRAEKEGWLKGRKG